ncbi:MAG: sporulation transcription factor Spo0A [Oscillospiraceae bacterium]|nr:sporulation transcription factor Spo0A [Oscillospiraceae bacterium]
MTHETMRIVLVDTDIRFRNTLKMALESHGDCLVVGEASDGITAVNLVLDLVPDIVLLEVVLPNLDGAAVLEHLQNSGLMKLPKVIALSYVTTEAIVMQIMAMGADYYMFKPVEMTQLHKRMRDLLHQDTTESGLSRATKDQRAQCAAAILAEIRMPLRNSGYYYLREAVCLVAADISLLKNLNSRLYPMLSAIFGSTSTRIERAIRHSIEVTMSHGDAEAFYRLFGNTIDPQRGKPTNREFIAVLAEYVRIGMKVG